MLGCENAVKFCRTSAVEYLLGILMKTLRLLLKGIFSLLAVLIGCSLILWVLYNEIIHRLPEYQRPPWAGTFGIAPSMIGIGLYWGRQVIQQLRAQPVVPADAVHGNRGQRR
ncbi:MAG: hypothetical protein ABSA26_00665 [Thermoguttaceae bacterium]|jgi:hypothetical protein